MEYGYVIKISNKNLYKEIQLPQSSERMKIGMDMDCDVRLYKEEFFEKFELLFFKTDNIWQISCSENVYIDVDGVRKLLTKKVGHGASFYIKYQNSDNEVFKVEFMFDFDNAQKKYNRAIDISNHNEILLGNDPNSNIVLRSKYIVKDRVVLRRRENGLEVAVFESTCGVYHNGKKVTKTEILKNGDFLSIADFSFYYKDGSLMTEADSAIGLKGLNYRDEKDRNQYPKFKRNTRIKEVVNDEKIEILDPPAKPEKPKHNLTTRLLSSFGMLASAAVMAYMGGAMIIMSLISAGMAIITTIVTVIQANKDYKEKSAERIEKYNNYIANKTKEVTECRNEELYTLEKIYISPELERQQFDSFSSELFDRRPDDEDFLSVRIGQGALEAKREINYKQQEKLEIEDDLQEMPKKVYDQFKYIGNAPIVCNFKDINALGIIGEPENRFSMMKNIVMDICARQYHSDVKMFFVAEKENKDKIFWLRMLPHVYNDVMGIRNIVCDDESKNLIFEYLYKELTIREQNKKFEERLIVFFYDEYGFNSHPISKFGDKTKELGVTFVFFGNKKSDIPVGCDYLIDIKDYQTADFINTADRNDTYNIHYPTMLDSTAKSIVEMLTPVYTEEISLESSLTKNISLFELLNIIAVDDLDLDRRWATSQVFKTMSAPIGVSKTGVVSLDLHDKFHGPHGLVAGTTGSGKSEILQTYILSMATLFHPYEVGFVIIDFKGGGMVNQFKDLPHLLGAITNIDGKEINRSLKSIKAELQKRQRLFADADVNHIDKYIKKYKAGEVKEALPHLIVVVDEFAELKAEQPEFMKELISAARIGRSLGVHLILATQKPSGQVNEQIWSNSRFKLCLKVQTQEDSNEVLKSPLAAEIKEAGRAYLQVGNNEIFELFQSAFSGAPEKADNSNVKEFSIISLTESGKRVPVYVQKKKKGGDASLTQLDAIVKYVGEYCKDKKIGKLPDICLPSLEHVIDFPQRDELIEANYNVTTEIGVYDDPDNQYQGTYSIDLANQNVMIIGSAQSGKTNILQNMIRSIASKYTPEEVTIYVMDFASMVLKNFETLNHVGGVVTASEDEKLKNLIKLLFTEIETRKEKLMSIGVSSFAAYKEAGMKDLPQIVVMIDNLTALKELYFQDDDELLNLCREGLSVGISVVIANSQTSGIGYKYLSNFSTRIALFCNDSGEYSSLFDHCRERIDDIHGRCIVEINKVHLECQTYLAFKGEKEIDRVAEIKEFIATINSENKGCVARRIPVIPASLTKNFIVGEFGNYMQEAFSIVTGLDYATVTPTVLDFANLGLLAISGRESAGKHNWIKYSVDMQETMYPNKSKVYVVDEIGKKLASLKEKSNVTSYSMIAEDAVTYIKEIEQQLKERYDALAAGNENVLDEAELLMLVIDNQDALLSICNNPEALAAYKNIIGRYKSMKACIITIIQNVNITYSDPEILKNIRDQRNILFFDDIANMKIFDIPLSVLRNYKKAIEIGDGYYINDNECKKLKTPICTR